MSDRKLPPGMQKLVLNFSKDPSHSPSSGTKIPKNSPRSIRWRELQNFMDDRAPSPDKPTTHSMVWLYPPADPASFNYMLEGEERFSDLQLFRPDPRCVKEIVPGEKYPAILEFREENGVNGEVVMRLQKARIFTRDGAERSFQVLR